MWKCFHKEIVAPAHLARARILIIDLSIQRQQNLSFQVNFVVIFAPLAEDYEQIFGLVASDIGIGIATSQNFYI